MGVMILLSIVHILFQGSCLAGFSPLSFIVCRQLVRVANQLSVFQSLIVIRTFSIGHYGILGEFSESKGRGIT